jgi:hypothetical protein
MTVRGVQPSARCITRTLPAKLRTPSTVQIQTAARKGSRASGVHAKTNSGGFRFGRGRPAYNEAPRHQACALS